MLSNKLLPLVPLPVPLGSIHDHLHFVLIANRIVADQWANAKRISATLDRSGVESAGMGDDRLVGLTEAARITGRSREWLRRMVNDGKIAGAVRVGNSIGIPDREVSRIRDTPKQRGGWPKGKPRKPAPDA